MWLSACVEAVKRLFSSFAIGTWLRNPPTDGSVSGQPSALALFWTRHQFRRSQTDRQPKKRVPVLKRSGTAVLGSRAKLSINRDSFLGLS